MGLFERMPYTNFHDLNLTWILNELKTLEHTINEFVSINALKYADPIQWNITTQYEKNTIVIDPLTGTAYISVQPVPSGVALTNTDYWTVVFDLGQFVVRAAKNFTNKYENETTLTATFPSNVNDWIIWGDTLYLVISPIVAGDQYVVGSNIIHFTAEDIIGHIQNLNTTDKSNLVAAINEVLTTLVNTAGDLADLNTTDKSNLVAAINEVLTDTNNVDTKVGDLTDLNTSDTTSIVNAVNSLKTDTENNLQAALMTTMRCYNVKDYGAVGDGVTDDTAAIQACIAAADDDTEGYGTHNVYFPDGRYVISQATRFYRASLYGNKPQRKYVDGAWEISGSWLYITNTNTTQVGYYTTGLEDAGAFVLGWNSKVCGFGVYYPDQTATPNGGVTISDVVHYSPTFIIPGGGAYGTEICDIIALNPFVLVGCRGENGNNYFHDIFAHCFYCVIDSYRCVDTCTYRRIKVNPNVWFLMGVNPDSYYNQWFRDHAYVFTIRGGDWSNFSECEAYYIHGLFNLQIVTYGGNSYGCRHFNISNCGIGASDFGILHSSAGLPNEEDLVNNIKVSNCTFFVFDIGANIGTGTYWEFVNCTFRECRVAINVDPTGKTKHVEIIGCKTFNAQPNIATATPVFILGAVSIVFTDNTLIGSNGYSQGIYFNSDVNTDCIISNNLFENYTSDVCIRVGGGGNIKNWILNGNMFKGRTAACVVYSQTVDNKAFEANIPTIS